MAEAAEQTTLHETIAASFDAVVPPDAPVETPAPAAATDAPAEAPKAADAPKDDARARDEQGRFAPKPKESATAPVTATTASPTGSAATTAPVAEPAKPAIQRPSSWKKDYWEAFDKLAAENPAVAQYILQRETEAARGVSTYKTEFDRAKPILDAITPHLPLFQQHGIEPGAQISRYVEIHKGLAMGTKEQKLGVLLALANDYKVPLQELFVQQNGQIYYNPQVQPATPQPQAAQPQGNIEQIVQQTIAKERTAAQIAEMAANTEKYPHFETLRGTMAQLLEAKLANDLPGAYDMALALPQHRELTAQQQQQQAVQAEAARKQQAISDAQRAKAAAVSPRSATPASGPAKASQGLRDALSSAFDEVAGSARV